jgi:hypothetical protein
VDSRVAIKCLIRLAWQDDLELHSISACRFSPASFFVDAGGSLRACGVELRFNEETECFLNDNGAA